MAREPASSAGATAAAHERELLDAARQGDERAYRMLVERHHAELHAHCYRMLGSLHDAEDALQDAMLRAWRGLPRFEGRSSLRAWLYRLATNTCLDLLARRPRRVLPLDHGPAADPADGIPVPTVERIWLDPYPEVELAVEDRASSPEARYEQREALELAFVAALQHLPANQRAVLILREVLGFSAGEVAESLDTTAASVNSALQRARKTVDERLPAQSQQAALRELADGETRELVQAYSDALEAADVDAVLALLTADATWSMPPLPSWFAGHEAIAGFLRAGPFHERWRHLPARANGQLAVGCYTWDEAQGCFVASVLDVLTLRGGRVAAVTAFITDDLVARLGHAERHYASEHVFARGGLPLRLPA